MVQHMLTTTDNPFDPFTQFDEWNAFDQSHGYNSINLLARVVRTSNNLSDADQELAMEDAIDQIVELNINGMFTKVAAS